MTTISTASRQPGPQHPRAQAAGPPRAQAIAAALPIHPVEAAPEGAPDWHWRVKRAVDIVGAAGLLVALAPLMGLVAAGIRLTSPGPALFVQRRVGRHGRVFRCFKFRSMVDGAERLQEGLATTTGRTFFKIDKDPRVTAIGRFIRKTSIDELPQLWNVLRGEMSLVGPRPLHETDAQRFPGGTGSVRFNVPPGITGLWQVSGRNLLPDDVRLRLDTEYAQNWSLALDAKILLKTLPVVLSSRGAY